MYRMIRKLNRVYAYINTRSQKTLELVEDTVSIPRNCTATSKFAHHDFAYHSAER